MKRRQVELIMGVHGVESHLGSGLDAMTLEELRFIVEVLKNPETVLDSMDRESRAIFESSDGRM